MWLTVGADKFSGSRRWIPSRLRVLSERPLESEAWLRSACLREVSTRQCCCSGWAADGGRADLGSQSRTTAVQTHPPALLWCRRPRRWDIHACATMAELTKFSHTFSSCVADAPCNLTKLNPKWRPNKLRHCSALRDGGHGYLSLPCPSVYKPLCNSVESTAILGRSVHTLPQSVLSLNLCFNLEHEYQSVHM